MRYKKLLVGNRPDVISANVNTLKNAGYSAASAMRCAMCHANKKHGKHANKVAAKVSKKEPTKVKVKPGGRDA